MTSPLNHLPTINARLDCVEELLTNEQMFFGLQTVSAKAAAARPSGASALLPSEWVVTAWAVDL